MFICDKGEEFIPRRATMHSAGYDFYATEDIPLKAGEWVTFDTAVRLAPHSMRENQVMFLMPRSSLGFKYGVRIRNTIGVIDADYTDNIRASLSCDVDYTIKKGERYMQGIITDFYTLSGEVYPDSERNGGVGSTGR